MLVKQKRHFHFVDDMVKTNKLTQCPAEKARTEGIWRTFPHKLQAVVVHT